MTVERFETPILLSNMYVIKEREHAILVDPYEMECDLDGVQVDYIILSHEHYDHISGTNYWRGRTGASVLCSRACADNISDPRKNMSRYFRAFSELQIWAPVNEAIMLECGDYICHADMTFEDSITIEWHGHSLYAFTTPGHSPGSTCYVIDERFVFAGDSIILGYQPSLRFPQGNRKDWERITVPRLRAIDREAIVYPGHFEEFNMKEYSFEM